MTENEPASHPFNTKNPPPILVCCQFIANDPQEHCFVVFKPNFGAKSTEKATYGLHVVS